MPTTRTKQRVLLKNDVRKGPRRRSPKFVMSSQEDSSPENTNSWKSPILAKPKNKRTKLLENTTQPSENNSNSAGQSSSLIRIALSASFYRNIVKSSAKLSGKLNNTANSMPSIAIPISSKRCSIVFPKSVTKSPTKSLETLANTSGIKLEKDEALPKPPPSSVYDQLEIRPSKIHGKGIFACSKVEKETFLLKYEGEIIGKCVSDRREQLYIKNGIKSVYMFKVDEDKIIDATLFGNKARYINHSCNPNCYSITDTVRGEILYFARRNILPDDELTIDYNFSEEDSTEACNCGSLKCVRRAKKSKL